MSLPYFPMYPTDFEAKTSHLTIEEDGAYNRILRLMWMTPGCSIPDDDAWIMRRMRVDADTYERVVRVVIDEFCERKNGRVSNARLMQVFIASNDAHEKRVSAGSKGGKAKALKSNDMASSNAVAKPKQPEPEPEPEPIKKEKNIQKKLEDDRFGLFWQRFPNKVGKPVARKSFSKALNLTSFETLMEGLDAYITSTTQAGRTWCNPSTWLNQERWNDKPALTTQPTGRTIHPRLAAKQAAIDQLFGDPQDEQRSSNETEGPFLMLPTKPGY